MDIQEFFDPTTFTLSYIVYDQESRDAVIIDPVLNFDQSSGKVSYDSVNELKTFAIKNQLKLHYILETHAHADHLSAAEKLKEIFPGIKTAINENIKIVQETFKDFFHLDHIAVDGSQFDVLLNEKDLLRAGSISIQTLFTPGHTPACSSFLIGEDLFVGDILFMPDYGTGRCDFPKGDAKALYQSVTEKLFKLPDTTKMYTGHDYMPNGRELRWMTTLADQKKNNIHITSSTSLAEYVEFRTGRDKTLKAPKLLLPSIQINIDAGKWPKAESNGVSYLKLPIGD